ncbi:MAG: hypothetical protein ACYCPN_03270 [Thermoplasmata archaeon]
MPYRTSLSEESDREEREIQDRLRAIDSQLASRWTKRQQLLGEVRRLSAEQKTLSAQRGGPLQEAEEIHQTHRNLGQELLRLRSERDRARAALGQAMIHYREVRAAARPQTHLRPEAVRKEIQELEHRQQTQALSLDDERALLVRLRERTRMLAELEAHAQEAAVERAREEAAARQVTEARAEVDRITQEFDRIRKEREATMGTIRGRLEAAGSVVAEIRRIAAQRSDTMDRLFAESREIQRLEQEGRTLLATLRARRAEARNTIREFTPRTRRAEERTALESSVDQRLDELLKRGRITLG